MNTVEQKAKLYGWYLPILFALISISGCTTSVKSPTLQAPLPNQAEAIAAYANVLDKYVNDRGEVDFPRLQKEADDLECYVAYIAKLDPKTISNADERLAHYINSYNALSMYNVLQSGIPTTHAGFAKVRFFYLRTFMIGGQELSLYDYENDIIRKLKEPRVHFALNCSALGCPVLPKQPFTGANLQHELTKETQKFFSESRNLRLDHRSKTAYLSELLDFYTEDFVSDNTTTLAAFVNRYAPETLPEGYTIEFIPYDWTVANSAR